MGEPTEDATMGDWVYCCAHLRPHPTGWCTVPASDKIRLGAKRVGVPGDPYGECRAIGLHIFQEPTPHDWGAQRDLAEMLDGRHYRSWLVDHARRDALISRLKGLQIGKQ